MAEVTRILNQIEDGDPLAAEELLPLVYAELRKLAAQRLSNEKPGQTLQATALVHEAYIRLVNKEISISWNGRSHFFATAAEVMRRILVDQARQKKSQKRGGDYARRNLEPDKILAHVDNDEVIAVHQSLDDLAEEDYVAASIVKLRYFGGFSLEEAAKIQNISPSTAYRLWEFARVWLRANLGSQKYS